VWVAVRRKDDELWLVPGDLSAYLKANGLEHTASEHWTGGPAKWDWGRVAYLLAPLRI